MTPAALPPLGPDEARRLLAALPRMRIAVVGDVMLDAFVYGRVQRISPEAPVPVLEFEREEYRPGGAANVAHNCRALGAAVDLVGLVGADETADRLRRELGAHGIDPGGLVVDPARRTTRKVRLVTTRHQQVARVDYEDDEAVGGEVERAMVDAALARAAGAGAVVISDYLKGVVTRRLVAELVAHGRARGVPVLIDPKIPHLTYYAGATLVTPNHHEAGAAAHLRIRTDGDAARAAWAVRAQARCDGVLITRGEHGMWLSADGHEGALPAAAREVADVTGAGDTVIATLALVLAAGGTVVQAARLANDAAGIAVGKFGPATVSVEELEKRLT